MVLGEVVNGSIGECCGWQQVRAADGGGDETVNGNVQVAVGNR